jgi:tagatose 6-phosphate kinase
MILTITLNASIDRTTFINNFTIGKINRSDQPIESAGGKGLNVTRVLKILGVESVATGFIGGKSGERLEDLMNHEGFRHDFVKMNGNTRSCLAIVDKEKNNLTEINENGPKISNEELESLYKKVEELSSKAKITVISGSLPTSLPSDVYGNLITIAKKNGSTTFLDASRQALKDSIGSVPYMIKPNKTEAEELLGFELNNQEDWMKGIYFLTEYCSLACITFEDKGCVIGNKREIYHASAPKIRVVNSVGSGDSFLAGFISGYHNNKSLSDCMKMAIAAGSSNAMTDRAGLIFKNDFENLLNQVEVTKIL